MVLGNASPELLGEPQSVLEYFEIQEPFSVATDVSLKTDKNCYYIGENVEIELEYAIFSSNEEEIVTNVGILIYDESDMMIASVYFEEDVSHNSNEVNSITISPGWDSSGRAPGRYYINFVLGFSKPFMIGQPVSFQEYFELKEESPIYAGVKFD